MTDSGSGRASPEPSPPQVKRGVSNLAVGLVGGGGVAGRAADGPGRAATGRVADAGVMDMTRGDHGGVLRTVLRRRLRAESRPARSGWAYSGAYSAAYSWRQSRGARGPVGWVHRLAAADVSGGLRATVGVGGAPWPTPCTGRPGR
jgi:hypothetical protein